MKLMPLVPAVAFAAALFATPALAVTLNGVELSEADVNIVTQHCEHLAANAEARDNEGDNDAVALGQNTDNSSDSEATGNAALGETGAAGLVAGIDLDTVNLAVCQEHDLID